jgi:hypothetical protein
MHTEFVAAWTAPRRDCSAERELVQSFARLRKGENATNEENRNSGVGEAEIGAP